MTQIESILNSCPLTPLSSDAKDQDALTPEDFLIGRTFVTISDPDFTDVPENQLTRYQLLHRLNIQFWNKWSKDYLHQLQRGTKWKTPGNNIEPRMMIIIKHDGDWALRPGKDNITRVMSVKVINTICVLPLKID